MSGQTLPPVGLGTFAMTGLDECREAVATALELGYRHIDTAQMYDNEEYVGDGLAQAAVPREDVFLATKVLGDNLAYDDVIESTEASLHRLGVDSFDLLYVHWPRKAYDPAETLAAFDDLHDDGKVDRVGLCNFTPSLLDEALDHLEVPLFAHQVEFHPFIDQSELLEYAQTHGHYLVAYSPLAKGQVFEEPEISAIAEKHGATEAQVSLAWLRSKENVVAIPKSSNPTHLQQNLEAVDVNLDQDDIERIDAIERSERIVDPDDAPWNADGR